MAKDDGGTAFPVTVSNDSAWSQLGMSLRDWFAGQALAGLLAKNTEGGFSKSDGVQRAVMFAFEYADAMLAERAND